MQDMGAFGVVSSSSEVAAKSGVGMIIDMDRIPLRESGMTPWEIALSNPRNVCCWWWILPWWRTWNAAPGGGGLSAPKSAVSPKNAATSTPNGAPWWWICPPSSSAATPPSSPGNPALPTTSQIGEPWMCRPCPRPEDFGPDLCALLGDPNLGNKEAIFQQYDSMVQEPTPW